MVYADDFLGFVDLTTAQLKPTPNPSRPACPVGKEGNRWIEWESNPLLGGDKGAGLSTATIAHLPIFR